jgi:hypothetical protein
MDIYWFFLGVLAVWRLTHLLQAEDGPADIVVKLRQKVGAGFWAKLLDCFQCLSLWVALPFAGWMGGSLGERGLLWLALSAGAIIVERWIPQTGPPQTPIYFEDKEEEDVLLRKSSDAGGKSAQ